MTRIALIPGLSPGHFLVNLWESKDMLVSVFLDQDMRDAMTQPGKGELLISHAMYRQPVRVIVPKPAHKQEQI